MPVPVEDTTKDEDMGERLSSDCELRNGPVTKRRCTDVLCLLLFVAHVVAFWVLSLLHTSNASLAHLYLPRDFRGQYCGLEKQWNNGDNLNGFGNSIYTLNLTESVGPIAQRFLCSPAGRTLAVDSAGVDPTEYTMACPTVGESFDYSAEMAKYTTFDGARDLLSGSLGSSILSDVPVHFSRVCVNSCTVDFDSAAQIPGGRVYMYTPGPDVVWHDLWGQVVASPATTSALEPFRLQALPRATCPYSGGHCVPLPGVSFSEEGFGYVGSCNFDVSEGSFSGIGGEASRYLNLLAETSIGKLQGGVDEILASIRQTWDTFVVTALIAFALSLVLLVLLRFCIKPAVYLTIVLVFLLFLVGGFVCMLYSGLCQGEGLGNGVAGISSRALSSDSCGGAYQIASETSRKTLFYVSFVVWALGLLYFVLVACVWGRIRLAVRINAAAAQFVYNTPHIVLVPILQAFCAICWTAIWLVMVSFLLSQVSPDFVPNDNFETYDEAYDRCVDRPWPAGLVWKDDASSACAEGRCWRCAPPRYSMDYRFAVSLFSFFWHHAFGIAIGQCIIAGAVGIWFFNKGERGSRSASMLSVCTSITTCIRFHLGSLAFGSLILAIIQTLKWLMRFLSNQAKLEHNKCLEVVFCTLACCLWCFEKSVKFLNKNAYIQVALMGTGFCASARNAFLLILRNVVRFGVLASIGGMVHRVGKLLIAAATGVLGFLLLDAMHAGVTSAWVLVVIYVIMGWVVGAFFMNVFGLAVDTTLQCFISTEEMGIDPSFIPPNLKKFVQGHHEKDGASDDEQKSCCVCCR